MLEQIITFNYCLRLSGENQHGLPLRKWWLLTIVHTLGCDNEGSLHWSVWRQMMHERNLKYDIEGSQHSSVWRPIRCEYVNTEKGWYLDHFHLDPVRAWAVTKRKTYTLVKSDFCLLWKSELWCPGWPRHNRFITSDHWLYPICDNDGSL